MLFAAMACGLGLRAAAQTRKTLRMKQHSGYARGVDQWERFLRCWHGSVQRDSRVSVLPRNVLQLPGQVGGLDALQTSVAKANARLGLSLPASYVDFLHAFVKTFGAEAFSKGKGAGMESVAGLRTLREVDPDAIRIAEEFAIESPDPEYFVYGKRQRDSSGRTSNLAGSLVLGRFGNDASARIVLYPQVQTADGELEAALHYPSGEFRAPTFAELMRQLSYRETTKVDHVPPYSQSQLASGCASELPIKAWWD